MRFPILLLIVMCLAGCNSPRQEQYLSNARAGAQALQDPNLTEEQREWIQDGTDRYLVLATDDMPLPAPEKSPTQIAADPKGFADDAKVAPPAEGFNGWLVGGLLGVAASAFPFLRNLPFLRQGATMVANLAFNAIAPKVARVRDQLAHAAYDKKDKKA